MTKGDTAVYFRIRPRRRAQNPQAMDRSLRALDEAFTEHLTGGVGEHDHVGGCAEVWLLDAEQEPLARSLIERHGWEVVDEEEILE